MERWNEPMLEPGEREAAISAILDRSRNWGLDRFSVLP